LPYLENSVGLNAIFVRCKNEKSYINLIDLASRKEIEKFCLDMNQKIINMVQPKKLIVIGFRAAHLIGESAPDLIDSRGQNLTKKAVIFGNNALIVKHLSGSRISNVDFDAMRQQMRQFVAQD